MLDDFPVEPGLVGEHDGLDSVTQSEFGEQTGHVGFEGLL
jgi:hypothetical protein